MGCTGGKHRSITFARKIAEYPGGLQSPASSTAILSVTKSDKHVMSFASQAREEIARRSLQKDRCVRAAAYGIACFAKYFDASGLVLQTEQELTTQVASPAV